MNAEQASAGSVPNPVSIEEIAKAARVRRVRKSLPYFHRRLSKVLVQALSSPGVQVVIAEAPCVACRPRKTVIPFRVDPNRCVGSADCSTPCLEAVGCPAIDLEEGTDRARIDPDRCLGCGLCANVCSQRAIRRDFRARRRSK
jgi:indolepyruvate ferredoxin oxidoreductase alpha subunit